MIKKENIHKKGARHYSHKLYIEMIQGSCYEFH